MDSLTALLDDLWNGYRILNPQVDIIHRLLMARGETLINDHIAFRTVSLPEMNIQAMARPFLNTGYKACGSYRFDEKKLNAVHFEHANTKLPKIFISELQLHELSLGARSQILSLVNAIPGEFFSKMNWCSQGRPWDLDFTTYEALERESEYAAWFSAFGFCANHFTVLMNSIRTFPGLFEFNQFLKSQGFSLNSSGGEIKGSPRDYLEQSSTLASRVKVLFKGVQHTIPGCYYEFAKRYPLPNGQWFQGFVTQSADKIFESTFRK